MDTVTGKFLQPSTRDADEWKQHVLERHGRAVGEHRIASRERLAGGGEHGTREVHPISAAVGGSILRLDDRGGCVEINAIELKAASPLPRIVARDDALPRRQPAGRVGRVSADRAAAATFFERPSAGGERRHREKRGFGHAIGFVMKIGGFSLSIEIGSRHDFMLLQPT